MKKHQHLWLILGVYGVWFAILSGLEELANGKYWKFLLSLLLGVIVYWAIELRSRKS